MVNKPRLGFVEDVFGYNSLFPLMLRLIPHEAEQLGHTLDKLVDPEVCQFSGFVAVCLILYRSCFSFYGQTMACDLYRGNLRTTLLEILNMTHRIGEGELYKIRLFLECLLIL